MLLQSKIWNSCRLGKHQRNGTLLKMNNEIFIQKFSGLYFQSRSTHSDLNS